MDQRILAVAALAVCSAGCLGSSYSQTLNVDFSPMYSGWDGVHAYQVPATIANAAVTGISNVSWSASDSSVVDLAPAADGIGVIDHDEETGPGHHHRDDGERHRQVAAERRRVHARAVGRRPGALHLGRDDGAAPRR